MSPSVKSAGMLLALHTIIKKSLILVLQTQHAVLERVSRLFLKGFFFFVAGGVWRTQMNAIQKTTKTTCYRCVGVNS